jgi:hypothetical protein
MSFRMFCLFLLAVIRSKWQLGVAIYVFAVAAFTLVAVLGGANPATAAINLAIAGFICAVLGLVIAGILALKRPW